MQAQLASHRGSVNSEAAGRARKRELAEWIEGGEGTTLTFASPSPHGCAARARDSREIAGVEGSILNFVLLLGESESPFDGGLLRNLIFTPDAVFIGWLRNKYGVKYSRDM